MCHQLRLHPASATWCLGCKKCKTINSTLKEKKESLPPYQLQYTILISILFLHRAAFRKHECVLTLRSSPSVCLQCSLSLGNTPSLRALRSTTLSTQSTNTWIHTINTAQEILKLSWYLSIMTHLLTLWVGAQIDFHTGWSVHLFFSGVHEKSKATFNIRK